MTTETMSLLNLEDFISSGQAAKLLGKSTQTIQGWDRQGKLRAYRHPINGFRLYLKADILQILEELNTQVTEQLPRPHPAKSAPRRRRRT
jgi:hypothetical protein